VYAELSPIIGDIPSPAKGNNISNTTILFNECLNMDEQKLAITIIQKNFILASISLCVST